MPNGEEEKLCESIFNTKIWDETRQCTSDSVEVYNLTHDLLLLYTTFIRMHKDQKKDKQKVKIQTNFPRVFESLDFHCVLKPPIRVVEIIGLACVLFLDPG